MRSKLYALVIAAAAAYTPAIAPQTSALAQNNPPGRKVPQKGDPKAFPVKPVIDADLATLDDELAAYLQFRGDVGADGAARLELLIDLRVTARWLLAAASAEKAESEVQIAAMLRAQELLDTARTLTELFKAMPRPTAPQLDGMTRLHALTYKLPELKQIKQIDDVCREIGSLLVAAAGPLPAEVRQIPLMRPAVVTRSEPVRPASTQPAVTLDPLSRANALAVSAPLKRQVINLLTLAINAEAESKADPKRLPEAAQLSSTAGRALDLSEALSKGTAVDASTRPQLEQRLADGLALFSDPRTRSSGQSRLASLDDYARTIARIRRLNLKPELQQKLAPAFAWAGDNQDQSGKLMVTVEAFLETSARLDARAATPPQPLPPKEAKAVADAIKAATAERDAFLMDASVLGKVGQTVDVASLAGRLESMKQAIASAETYEAVPKSLQVLLTFKPRPTGAMERRFAGLLTALNDPRPSAAKDEAGRAMADMVRLADLASELEWPAPVTQDVQSLYTRGKLPAFETRRKELVAEIASELAAGRKADTSKMQRLEQMRELRGALAEAVMFEVVVRKAEPLSRWIDWRIDAADVQAVIAPYRESLGSLFEAYSTDATPPVTFKPLHERYSPFMRFVIHQLPYGDPCSGLPTSLAGHIGRLMTPMDNQPFATERYASFAIKLWKRHRDAGDAAAAEVVAAALAARVK
ncbi:hypothetical protein [Humisphaera borealis]|uniref:Uncharacterized protein n=1 Tax=Humisphaera borealis TaxID=2807512 RepID=A0A7M2X0U8_9BACT|nr:hypothetical protein [Humisphaera borealis]QOV91368.1 hypothetical protein IPV69_08455 [Humisphaera borealis]